jgi:hypothetical protein
VLWKTPKAQGENTSVLIYFGSIVNVKFMLTFENSELSLFSASLENFSL